VRVAHVLVQVGEGVHAQAERELGTLATARWSSALFCWDMTKTSAKPSGPQSGTACARDSLDSRGTAALAPSPPLLAASAIVSTSHTDNFNVLPEVVHQKSLQTAPRFDRDFDFQFSESLQLAVFQTQSYVARASSGKAPHPHSVLEVV
jgi:hypothetical protein